MNALFNYIYKIFKGSSYSKRGDLSCCDPAPAKPTPKSIPTEVTCKTNTAEVKINYNAPAVRGRIIWGGLVPYGQPWVTGAHDATAIEISKDFSIGGKIVSAGKYAIFTIPGPDEWAVILNRNWKQHLTDEYDQTEDVVRFSVVPHKLESLHERLEYSLSEKAGGVVVSMHWEYTEISFVIEI